MTYTITIDGAIVRGDDESDFSRRYAIAADTVPDARAIALVAGAILAYRIRPHDVFEVRDEAGVRVAAIPFVKVQAAAAEMIGERCVVCGTTVSIEQRVTARSRGQEARYCSTTCRGTAAKRRQRATRDLPGRLTHARLLGKTENAPAFRRGRSVLEGQEPRN